MNCIGEKKYKKDQLGGNSEILKQEKEILVSVIIPVYNAEKYIKTCLDSIIGQTHKKIEILCVDDGSTDHSLEVLRFFANKDDRIHVYTQDNAGPAAARNKALNLAKGDYISFVDADDFLQPNAYEILVECALQKENWDLIIFGGNVIGEQNAYIADKLTTVFKQYKDCKPAEVIFKEKAARPFLWLHFIKREILEKPVAVRFDESLNLGEDQIFQFTYIPRAKNVMVIDVKFYNYRITKNASLMQLYNNRKVQKTEVHFQIVEKAIKEWKKYRYYDENKDELWNWAISFIYWSIFEFPLEFKKQYADKFLMLFHKYDVEEYLISEYEVQHYKSIREWAMNELTTEQELKSLILKTEREQYEIDETLKSRAFKLGRLLTPKKKRIDSSI